ncbi:MAG: arginase family protein, partial [Bdellovibrionales bacterium]|nr:arginase family protein [Bdellovibrionales bacterium]
GFSSGTPFYRLMEKYGEAFDLIEIGAQFHCNSTHHIHWCQDHGVRILFWEDIMYSGESAAVVVGRFLEEELLRPRPVYLSVDIDGFSSAIAMGCSQSWATGWSSLDFFPVLHMLLSRWDVRSMGIYEVSPPLDEDNRTSKLAAQIAHRFIFHHRTPS